MVYERGELTLVDESGFQDPQVELVESVEGVAVAGVDVEAGLDVAPPVAMFPAAYMAKIAEDSRDKEAVAAERVEALRILGEDAYKLGDLNPLIHPVDLGRKESVDAARLTVVRKIQEHGGLIPDVLESTVVFDPSSEEAGIRFVARFEVPSMTEEQIVMLEELVGQTYGVTVNTRTDSKGNDRQPESYPPTQMGEEMKSKTGGWYMGPNLTPTTSLHQGLFMFRDLGQINKDNFLQQHDSTGRFIVEIREGSMYQTDLVTFVTQVATILGQEQTPDRGQLLYETYYDLIRLGLKKVEAESIYGMEGAYDMIRRELILPLANPEISEGVNEDPQSVLMIGVPGTGKTLLVEGFLQEDTGLFILPIDPFELQKELSLPKEKQQLMPRIAEISRITGKRVILHVDDIENMIGENQDTNSTMLNLMAGVQESGFYIIASTNYPEKINTSLIQPQRFSVLIHCGLQSEEARFEILKIHADLESKKLDMPLFSSEEVRDVVLREVAAHTKGFTPRYLGNVATIAKSHLVSRVAKATGKSVGLTEEDLDGYAFTVEDWEQAFAEVAAKYNSKAVIDRDDELAKFVKNRSMVSVGFSANGLGNGRIFSRAVFDRVIALETGDPAEVAAQDATGELGA